MADKILTEEESKELSSYILDAHEKHVTHPSPFIPGYHAVCFDTDIQLGFWKKTLHQGIYQLKAPEAGMLVADIGEEYQHLWCIQFDQDSLFDEYERAKSEGRVVTQEDEDGNVYEAVQGSGQFNLSLVRVDVDDDRPLLYQEALAWLAIQDATNEGNTEKARRILQLAYRLGDTVKVEEGKEAAADLPSLDAIAVKTHVIPNSKPTQMLRKGHSDLFFEPGGYPMNVGGQATINFELMAEEPVTEIDGTIDTEDLAVIEAVTSLKNAGNAVISPWQIAVNMGYRKPSTDLQREIHQRVLRLRGIIGRIDWTEQAKRWKRVNPETGKLWDYAETSGSLLNVSAFYGVDTDGNEYIRYKINDDPITYTHASLVGQVVNVPSHVYDLMPIDEDGNIAKRVTQQQVKLIRAIAQWIYTVKNPKNKMSDTISYEKLFEYDGYEVGSESARKRAIKFIHGYLRALQADGEIAGFEPIVEPGRRHKQIQVRVFVKKPR